uniref:Putative secreted protein n=1 Tax=Amblyomma americanum TaxID=6943 RepID=A0A0C9S3F5_AMBAM
MRCKIFPLMAFAYLFLNACILLWLDFYVHSCIVNVLVLAFYEVFEFSKPLTVIYDNTCVHCGFDRQGYYHWIQLKKMQQMPLKGGPPGSGVDRFLRHRGG